MMEVGIETGDWRVQALGVITFALTGALLGSTVSGITFVQLLTVFGILGTLTALVLQVNQHTKPTASGPESLPTASEDTSEPDVLENHTKHFLSVLTDEYCRHVFDELQETERSIPLTDLSWEVAARRGNTTADEVDREAYVATHRALFGTHLDHLDGVGVVDFDPAVGMVTMTEEGRAFAEYVSASPEPSSPADIALDVIFDALRSDRRRILLTVLDGSDGEATLPALATELAAREAGTTAEYVTENERKRVHISIYQTHLPKLADLDLIDYETGTNDPIQLNDKGRQVLRYLDTIGGTVDLGIAMDILRNARRRTVLERLVTTDATQTLDALAAHVAAVENGCRPTELSDDQRKRVYVGLYQAHLPKMDDAGVVVFDDGRITLTDLGHEHYDLLSRAAGFASAEATWPSPREE